MKTRSTYFPILLVVIVFALPAKLHAQFGRILINEYLPWPGNACGQNAEFVELFNMGPGPVDISCYVVTDGDFAVTIPPGTIVLPGQFYVLGGQNVIFAPCGNFTKNVVPNLNWMTCGCTNSPIAAFGTGWMTDGGFANEQVVLLSPTGNLVDAIVRGLPPEVSSTITTRALPGCTPFTFDLDGGWVSYETVGESTGRGNSIARKLDGDCGWVKDTQQTASETNNTPGARSPFTLTMYISEDLYCAGGTARFVVDQVPASNWFPVDYILGFDSDGDGLFTMADTYTTGIDYTAPDLEISGLPFGLYAINIGPRQGCSYQNFTFAIGPCSLLGYQLHSFSVQKLNDIQFFASISGGDELREVVLEGSINGRDFARIDNVNFTQTANMQNIAYSLSANTEYSYFRLMLVDRNQKATYSSIRRINSSALGTRIQLAGNPVINEISLYATTAKREAIEVELYNGSGQQMYRNSVNVPPGTNLIKVPTDRFPRGVYYLKTRIGQEFVESFRVMKQ
jgi:hypothetical protein